MLVKMQKSRWMYTMHWIVSVYMVEYEDQIHAQSLDTNIQSCFIQQDGSHAEYKGSVYR